MRNDPGEEISANLTDVSLSMGRLAASRGEESLELRLATMGRLVEHLWLSGGIVPDGLFAFSDPPSRRVRLEFDACRDGAFARTSAPWQVGSVHAEGNSISAWVDFDVRPDFLIGRWGALRPDYLVGELMVKPRESGLVPSWMKVELAVAGLWDVDRDVASWDGNFEPLSRVVSREVAEAAFAGQPLVSEVLFGAGGPPPGLSRHNPLVLSL